MAKKRPSAPRSEPSPKAAPRKASKPATAARARPATGAAPAGRTKAAQALRAKAEKGTERRSKGTRKTAAAPRPPTRSAKAGPLDIVMIASEMHPFATSGGLSEVVHA